MAELEANFTLNNEDNIDALFEIYATGTTWGNIDGSIENQTDLYNTLTDLAGGIESNHQAIGEINTTIGGYGDIVTYNAADFATSGQGELADTALQPNDNISELNNDVGYITSASLPTVNNATITIQKNGSTVESFTLNQSNNETVNITVPTSASDIGALPSSTTIEDLTTTAQLNAINSGATSTNIGQIATNTSAISTINGKIPSQASTSNQLADKNFVNSSIATNTANFIGTFNSVAELEAYSGTLTNNDYAFVETTDSAGNTLYDRYKYTTATNPASWQFEYELNNSSFTSNQWAAINSGITSSDVTAIGTALQPNDNITQLTNNAGYITSAAISSLTDVDLTNLSNGEGLIYNANSQKWENGTLATSATWGNITGTLSDQTDLQQALDTKQNTLIAGNNLEIIPHSDTTTVDGTETIDIAYSYADGLTNAIAYGNCVLSGTPTEGSPVTIACNNGTLKVNSQGVYADGTTETVVLCTKNLVTNTSYISNYYINANGVITYSEGLCYSDLIPVKPSTTYTWSASTTATTRGRRIHAYDTDGVWVEQITNFTPTAADYTRTFTTGATTKFIRMSTAIDETSRQLEYGSTATTYVSTSQTATVQNLLGYGDYADSQDLISGAVTRKMYALVLTGDETWTGAKTGDTYRYYISLTIDSVADGSSNRGSIICTHFTSIHTSTVQTAGGGFTYSGNKLYLIPYDQTITTSTDFANWVKTQYQNGTPIIVVYPMADTTTETVTGQTLTSVQGLNTLQISQASITNLGLRGVYSCYTDTINFVNNSGYVTTADLTTGKYIKNTSTGTSTITIDGTPTNRQQSINIGAQSLASGTLGVALGFDAQINNSGAVCMGYSSRGSGVQALGLGYRGRATANYAIQLGYGTNSTASTMCVGFNNTNYQLLDGTTGKIPNARLNTLVGADGTNAGTEGIVPAPTATDNTKFLRGDGTWAEAGGGGGTVDQTYDATSTNAQSGTAVAGAISTKQNTLIAGDDIHFTTMVGLPYDYTEVASITNAATTYINTGVRVSSDNAIMEIRFTQADATEQFNYIWQQRSSSSGPILGLTGSSTGQTIGMSVNNTTITSGITRTSGHTYYVRATYNSGNGTLYVKDETTGTEDTKTGTYTWGGVNKDLYLFGNGINTSQVCGAGITVSYLKLTVAGSVKLEGCFAKNSSGTAGFYNTVNRTFCVATSGSVTAGAELDKDHNIIYADGFLKNTATTASSSGTLTILGNPSSNTQGVNIGTSSQTGSAYVVAVGWNAKGLGQYSTAIGRSTTSSGQNSTALGSGASASGAYSTIVGSNSGATGNSAIAIGINAKANADYAIQIGNGTNATASTLAVGFNGTDFQLLDGTTGKIPDERISTNIARTADLATAVSTDLLTIGNTSINESQLQALLALI